MLATLAFSAFAAAGATALVSTAVREHREAMAERGALLADAVPALPGARLSIGPDRFPRLDATTPAGDGVTVELIADTLVTRRLPQLWLKLTLRRAAGPGPTLGVLARPTGAEFWSLAGDLPDRLLPPFAADLPVVVRGRGEGAAAMAERSGAALARLFADPRLKEVVLAPGGVRVVRQLAEGDRGAHILFRQVRFPVDRVPPEALRAALADAEALDGERVVTRSREAA